VRSQAIDDIRSEGSEALGETMGNSYDQLTRAVWVGGSTIQFALTAGSRAQVGSGMRMSSAELREAVATLETNDAQQFEDGGWKAIIHPKTKADLLNDFVVVAKLSLNNGNIPPGQPDASSPRVCSSRD
jgi:N4-gp56 family major capsid protein